MDNGLDKVIEIAAVLLILSLITEKISNLIKDQLPSLAKTDDESKKTSKEIQKRNRIIQYITISVGIGVALVCKANFFYFFDDGIDLFWTSASVSSLSMILKNVIGSIMTGFFLSPGAKFFHDLLDTLLQVRNLKRKLNDKQNWEFSSITEFDEYIKDNEGARLKQIVNQNLESIEGVLYSEIDYDKKRVAVHVERGTTGIPSRIPFKAVTGKTSWIEVTVKEEDSQIKTLDSTLVPSDPIANANTIVEGMRGSFAYPMERKSDGKPFVLTCYHAVWNEKHDWDIFLPVGKEEVVHPESKTPIGTLKIAFKNSLLDVALVEPDSGLQLDNDIPMVTPPKAARQVDITDKQNQTSVKIRSGIRKGEVGRGRIHDVNVKVNIRYPDGIVRSLSGLMLIRPYDNTPFSVGGDSGALVIDEWDYAVGLVVAGNESDTSFAIPITTVLDSLNLKLRLQ